jgi:hypothetical protein
VGALGLQDACGRRRLPAISVPAMGDHPSAMALFGAIMLALYQRERTGQGSKVHSSLLANGAWSNSIYLQAMLCGAESFRHVDCRAPDNALVNQYETADGEWILLALVRYKLWPGLCRALERPDLVADPRCDAQRAARARQGLYAIVAPLLASREYAHWRKASTNRRHLHPRRGSMGWHDPQPRPGHPALAGFARARGSEHREPDQRRGSAPVDAPRARHPGAHRRGARRPRLRQGRPRRPLGGAITETAQASFSMAS